MANETTEWRGYGHDLDTIIAAAKRWCAEHAAGQAPKLTWYEADGTMIIGALAPWIETIAANAAGQAFLEALDRSLHGRATVIMAQVAHHEATKS